MCKNQVEKLMKCLIAVSSRSNTPEAKSSTQLNFKYCPLEIYGIIFGEDKAVV